MLKIVPKTTSHCATCTAYSEGYHKGIEDTLAQVSKWLDEDTIIAVKQTLTERRNNDNGV